jgi:hypothetical protein
MKISVTYGDVAVKSVLVRDHDDLVYSVRIATPLDSHALVSLGSSCTRALGLSQVVELYRPLPGAFVGRRYSMDATRIVVTPESWRESEALNAGLFPVDWGRFEVVLFALPPAFLARVSGGVIASWESPAAASGVDYLPSDL